MTYGAGCKMSFFLAIKRALILVYTGKTFSTLRITEQRLAEKNTHGCINLCNAGV